MITPGAEPLGCGGGSVLNCKTRGSWCGTCSSIGWPRFFKKTGLTFTKHLIDDWRGSRANLNASTHIRF